jgi:hypothetical protein
MPVICAACHTENRDAAMFCHGCARKLPAFHPMAPSILETLRAAHPPTAPATARDAGPGPIRIADRRARIRWFEAGAALLVLALGLGGWLAHRMLDARAPTATVARLASTPAPAKAAPWKPSERVPVDASLAPGEAQVTAARPAEPAEPAEPATPPAPSPPPAIATAPPVVAPPAPEARRQPPRAVPPPRVTALDPRHGCETLNFVFAARCEAAHCDKPQYARHPRCNLVREERRRDEARRNPTLIF